MKLLASRAAELIQFLGPSWASREQVVLPDDATLKIVELDSMQEIILDLRFGHRSHRHHNRRLKVIDIKRAITWFGTRKEAFENIPLV